jgi:hypothetical protein
MGWKVTFGGTRRPEDEYLEALTDDPYASKWEGGTVVDLEDLPPDAFEKIAGADGIATWWGVFRFPAEKGPRMLAVIAAAAEHAGVDVPPTPKTMREQRELLELLELTEEPGPRDGGFPTKPSTAPDSSTGQSDASDGSPQSLDENEPEI